VALELSKNGVDFPNDLTKNFRCRRCGKECSTLSGIRRHQMRSHNVSPEKSRPIRLREDAESILMDGYKKVRKVQGVGIDEVDGKILHLMSGNS
jgi:hypothetical protein